MQGTAAVAIRLPALALSALAAFAAAGAQTWRTVDVSRQLHDTSAIAVHLEYAAGKFDLKAATDSVLYRATVRYDAERAEPVATFDPAGHVLSLGVHMRGVEVEGIKDDHDAGSMHAELSGAVPLDLTIDLGAVEANLHLGGLRVTEMALRGGAADVTARFDTPNRADLRTMTLEVGAAQMKLLDVANAGVSHIVANVGAGALSIDLGGTLTHDVDITATLAMGGLKLNVSPDVGVFVDERTLLGTFDKAGFVKRGDGWYSDNYNSASRHVKVHLHAFIGGLTLTTQQR